MINFLFLSIPEQLREIFGWKLHRTDYRLNFNGKAAILTPQNLTNFVGNPESGWNLCPKDT